MKKLNEAEVRNNGAYIQGDVVFLKSNQAPEGKPVPNGVVAEGEATGHAHRVADRKKAVVITNPNALVKWVKALDQESDGDIAIEHEEHKALNLPNEDHISMGQHEFDWAQGLRRTQD